MESDCDCPLLMKVRSTVAKVNESDHGMANDCSSADGRTGSLHCRAGYPISNPGAVVATPNLTAAVQAVVALTVTALVTTVENTNGMVLK